MFDVEFHTAFVRVLSVSYDLPNKHAPTPDVDHLGFHPVYAVILPLLRGLVWRRSRKYVTVEMCMLTGIQDRQVEINNSSDPIVSAPFFGFEN